MNLPTNFTDYTNLLLMSYLGRNIKKIRTVKKLSQSEFAELFDLSRASIGSYEEERAEAKIDTIIQIANHFSISIDHLLKKELTINEIVHFDIFKHQVHKNKTCESILIIPCESPLLYTQAKNYNAFETLESKNTDKLRIFVQEGSQMGWCGKGIGHKDKVIARKIEGNIENQLQLNRIYVWVTSAQILILRLLNKDTILQVKSDNSDYPIQELNSNDLIECWEVVGVYKEISL